MALYAPDDKAAIEEARVLFKGRVVPELYPVFERVFGDAPAAQQVRPRAWGGGLVVPPRFANVNELGPAAQVWVSKENVILVPALATLAGAVCLVMGLGIALTAELSAALGPLLAGVLLSGVGLNHLRRIRQGASAVVVFESGFAAAVGANVSAWHWDEVTSVVSNERFVSGKRRGTTQRTYEVWKGDACVVLTSDRLLDVRLLAERIKEHTGRLLRPSLRARYDAGQALTFGPVSVSLESIGDGSQQLTWSQVQNVEVKDGRLIVTPKDGSALKVRASRIPNIELLGELIGIPPSEMDLVYV